MLLHVTFIAISKKLKCGSICSTFCHTIPFCILLINTDICIQINVPGHKTRINKL